MIAKGHDIHGVTLVGNRSGMLVARFPRGENVQLLTQWRVAMTLQKSPGRCIASLFRSLLGAV